MIATEVKYKKTGNEWVPEIPEHWEKKKTKNIGYFEGSTVDKKIVKHDKLVRIVNFLDIYNNETFEITEDVDFMKVSATEHQIKNLKVNVGDVVFTPSSEIREDIGKSAVVKYSADDLLFSYHVSRLKFTREIDINFKKYLFNNKPALKHFSKNCIGSTRKILNRIDFKNLPVYLPPLEEQKVIADYLDTQTAKITHFIQTKQRFIELLKEQRQSIITNAVTKGIDEVVKMKETVLGEIPEHWEVRRLKFLADVNFSTVDKHSHKEEKQVRLCNYVDVYKHEYITNDFDFMIATATDAEIKRFTVEKGDVIITKDSETAADIAIPALIVEDLENVVCAYHLAHIKPNRELIESEFLFRLFQSKKINSHFEVAAKGVTRHGLSYDDINSVFLPYPPTLNEQQEIIKHIKTETRTLDIAINKAEREIELIKEYREAMIAEAVTGKLKL